MINCRAIPKAAWEQARKALVFYFSHRHGIEEAEDLAQDTLAAVWAREDFVFPEEKDFLMICYGFAKRILLAGYRNRKKHESTDADLDSISQHHISNTMSQIELQVLLNEVYEIGSTRLKPAEWRLIEMAATSDRSEMAADLQMGDANNVRVHLHRARKKLAKLVGFSRSDL